MGERERERGREGGERERVSETECAYREGYTKRCWSANL